MTLLDYIRHLFKQQQPSPDEGRKGTTRRSSDPASGIKYEGKPYNARSDYWGQRRKAGRPMAIATVYRCVTLLSQLVASLDIQVKRRVRGVFKARESRLWYLLNVQPTKALGAFDMKERLMADYLMRGNAYLLPVYSYGEGLTAIELIPPACVQHDTEADTYTVAWAERPELNGTYGEDEMIHIKSTSGANAKHGMGVLEYARKTVEIAAAAGDESLERMSPGGGFKAVVSYNMADGMGYGDYVDQQLSDIASELNSQVHDSGSSIYYVPGDAKVSPLTMTSADMQFLESLKFNVREICRFFGVPPSFVFDDTSNNYKSAEMANVAFTNNTVNPILRNIENELLRKLVPEEEAASTKIEFDRRGLVAADLEGRMRYLSQMLSSGLATVNELRKDEDREPVEGGDVVLVSANLRSIQDLSAQGSGLGNANDNNE